MQRHRHNDVEMESRQPIIIQRSTKPERNKMTQMNLAPVFEFVNDFANDPAAAVCSHGCVEVNCAVGAVGTGKCAGDRTFERFGAFLAKWRQDAYGLCLALIAEIHAGSNASPADRADRWVKKRCGRFQQFRLVKRDHISATFALLSKSAPLRPVAQ